MIAMAMVALGLFVLAASPAYARKPVGITTTTFVTSRLSNPSRTVVSSSGGTWIATFTDNARSVSVAGPTRTFSEPSTTSATVKTNVWVRILKAPFTGAFDSAWLSTELSDTSPDVLAIAMQYIAAAPSIYNANQLRIAGDANYGPLLSDGTRAAGSDFNDYLGVTWTYPTGTSDAPESSEYSSLDCSGYARMLFGYRLGVPMSLSPDAGKSLPRHSWEIADSAPGIMVIPNTGVRPPSRSALQPGDLLFFDATTTDGTKIDHVGVYLGRDSAGHDRFISSRKTANGPTLGDLGGASVLDGSGLYATSFRASRRI
jgi:cell wall-associated NlpC family hydrolase